MRKNNIKLSLQKAIAHVLIENGAYWKTKLKQLSVEAKTLQELQKELPEGWVPLRIAVSCYLTQGANVDKLIIPRTKDEWIEVWQEIKPKRGETKAQLTERFKCWLKERGNHRNAERFAPYYADYWAEREFDPKNSIKDLKRLQKAEDRATIECFWQKIKGIGVQYAKNIPMDEKNKHFKDCIKVDSRLKGILKGTVAEQLSDAEKEQLYLEAGRANGLNGWETDRLCFNFSQHIKQHLNKINK